MELCWKDNCNLQHATCKGVVGQKETESDNEDELRLKRDHMKTTKMIKIKN